MRIPATIGIVTSLLTMWVASAGCGDDTPSPYGPAEQTGQTCTTASQCFPDVAPGALQGDAVCVNKVPNGYCTHTCESDVDCCAVPGECRTTFPQACSPFESTGDKYCFLSCEDSDLQNAGYTDATAFCHAYANAGFTCKSSGGGAQNRKICVP